MQKQNTYGYCRIICNIGDLGYPKSLSLIIIRAGKIRQKLTFLDKVNEIYSNNEI